jgi:hypothetical protein
MLYSYRTLQGLHEEDLVFMDECCLISRKPTATGLCKDLQDKSGQIKEWDRTASPAEGL